MVADCCICTTTKNSISVYTADFNNIICYKAVASFYKFKGCFTFTNTGVARKKNTNTVYFYKYTMEGFMRSKDI